jgi:transformation/transcription domain-associated protein
MYDDEKGTLSDAVDKYSTGVPPIQWLPWVPQLLTSLVRHDGKMIINLLNTVGRMYPQAVYFPIRTLYLTLKVEQRERVRSAEIIAAANAAAAPTPAPPASASGDEASAHHTPTPQGGTGNQQSEAQAIKATPSMWRCSRIMHMQRDLHPTVLSSLEGIVDQVSFKFRGRLCFDCDI